MIFPPQVGSVTLRDTTPPSVAGPSSTPVLALASLNDTMIPLAVGSHSRTPATASPNTSVSTPALVLPIEPTPAPAPAAQDADSQTIPATQDDTQPATTAVTSSTDPPSCTVETVAAATTLESPTGPSTSIPGPAGNPDTQTDSQDAQSVPSTSKTSKTAPVKAPAKRTKAQASKKITAK